MSPRLLLALALLVTALAPQQGTPAPDPVSDLVRRLETAMQTADRAALTALLVSDAAAPDLVATIRGVVPTRLIVKERDRTLTASGAPRLLVEMFAEDGSEGRLSTWGMDLAPSDGGWKIAAAVRIAYIAGLHRLALDRTKQFDVRDLTVRSTDLTLQVRRGSAFVAETRDGVTAVVLLGSGEMRFGPPDPAEKTQVRIFSGNEVLTTGFDAAFIRVRPEDFAARFPAAALTPREVSPRDQRRALDVFNTYVGRTLQIDLADISRDRWSITPQAGDFIAEIRTRRFGTLTFTRSTNDAEDVTLFDRARRRNISVYASPEKLAARGRFYSEDDLVDYDILEYDIDTTIAPDRFHFDGTTRVKLRIRGPAVSTLNLRLAETLNVRSVYSEELGRLLHLRVTNQHALLVSLPGFAPAGTELTLTILYSGRVQPQELDREAITVAQDPEPVVIPPEPRHLYSHRAYWYPQSSVSDYAVARLRITAPEEYEIVATGKAEDPVPAPASGPGQRGRRVFAFSSDRPVRYLAFVVSDLRHVERRTVGDVQLRLEANPRQVGRARTLADRSVDIFAYYRELSGRAPYPAFTVAFTEREVPGGHSPPYFAVVDQPLQVQGITWRNDPVNFETYPAFFLAHEIAHQWWGQAVGWKNYHEQWLSEGFAQYFAVLYAEHRLSRGALTNVMKQMRQTAVAQSAQGPVYLGYRLGHIKGQTGVFRSLIYNKSAMVLHMLRRFVGDEAFFTAIREFYDEWEFKKAGTDDLRTVMERASGRDLSRFFETWIFGERVPRLKFSHREEPNAVILRFEQEGAPTDVPVMVTLTDQSGANRDVLVRVSEPVTETRIEYPARLRSATANADHGALVTIVR